MNNEGWRSKEAAQRFERVSSYMIPGRSEVLELVASLATKKVEGGGLILDLGSGYGSATAAVLKNLPGCRAILVDYSDEMIRLAKENFQGKAGIEIIKHDLNQGLPGSLGAAACDAVVSCFAFHHINPGKRAGLYAQIRQALKDGGIFVNGDRFREESAELDEWTFDGWMRWIAEKAGERTGSYRTFEEVKTRQLEIDRDYGDKPCTIWTMEKELRAAGFSQVDCLYKNRVIGVLAALK
jgi:tRNA (cmo5U34)-methyltransferase